ncbi:Arabinanase/levansucrase/invertase [Coniochaeta ligniaria NRRL 30616]|uniref:Arabinanase/levansucrase/invertase n=1 Tax=Coniochaeta ligniaria NRRL 30616 TaxID=1408157 RepID=A0A1J7IQ10_9PEZI|nr:Arabinanase/levansucrase/invertase [Coniochaeta ligniaria NRRL 30616]
MVPGRSPYLVHPTLMENRNDETLLASHRRNNNQLDAFDHPSVQIPLASPPWTPSSQKSPILPLDFPDPSILHDTDGTWYAFATAGNGRQIQVATSPSASGPWTYLQDVDVLPDTGPWTTGQNTWAPDVRRVGEGRYVMYYSGQRRPLTSDSGELLAARHYCLGVAVASSPLGPYVAAEEPWACAEERGGIIDPSGFLDPVTGRRYVVYKIDGNSVGHGGSCGNGVAPLVATPIMLQEVDAGDGVARVGEAVEVLDREEVDGPLVEAPSLAYLGGRYVLFYSSHCWIEGGYNVNYATAERVEGPYRKSRYNPLVQTGDFGLTAPGGATVVEGQGRLVFHANCAGGRCMFEAAFSVDQGEVIVMEGGE